MSTTPGTELKQMLETRRCELQSNLDAKLRDVRENSGYEGEMIGGLDTAETSDVDLQQDIDIALLEMKAQALGHVQDALARLASGTYGQCAECGAKISQQRLTALPYALRCRTCEEEREPGTRRSRRLAERRVGASLFFDDAPRD
jgi:RNA polymerase-binding transcription factor